MNKFDSSTEISRTAVRHFESTPIAPFAAALEDRGLLLLAQFSLEELDEVAPAEALLPNLDGENPGTGVLIGSGKELWRELSLRGRADDPDPIDALVERALSEVLQTSFPRVGAVRYGHHLQPAPYPMQHLADFCGFPRGPLGLNIHEERGPWFALRAVAVIPLPLVVPRDRGPEVPPPCSGCEQPCRRPRPSDTVVDLAPPLRLYLGAREACPVGLKHRYERAQVSYHYSKNSGYLPIFR